MTPVLGVIASSNQQGRSTVAGAYEQLGSVVVPSSGAASIVFGNIPQTYAHLQIRWSARSTGTNINAIININDDTSSSAYWHLIYGTGSAAAAYAISTSYISIGGTTISTDLANVFAGGITDILDYGNTNKNKTVRTQNGFDLNGGGYTYSMAYGQWINTAAITKITIKTGDAANWAQNSSFALYGIKGN